MTESHNGELSLTLACLCYLQSTCLAAEVEENLTVINVLKPWPKTGGRQEVWKLEHLVQGLFSFFILEQTIMKIMNYKQILNAFVLEVFRTADICISEKQRFCHCQLTGQKLINHMLLLCLETFAPFFFKTRAYDCGKYRFKNNC